MGKKAFKYILTCMAIYLLIAFIEVYLLLPLVNKIGTDFWTHFKVYTILLVLVNPIITYFVANLFGYKSQDDISIITKIKNKKALNK